MTRHELRCRLAPAANAALGHAVVNRSPGLFLLAALAYDREARRLFGEFARVNFPDAGTVPA